MLSTSNSVYLLLLCVCSKVSHEDEICTKELPDVSKNLYKREYLQQNYNIYEFLELLAH